MRINFNRLSVLAGLPAGSSAKRNLREGYMPEEDHDMDEMADIAELDEGDYMDEEEMAEGDDMDDMDDMDEVIEVDEAVLVQELRRAKQLMQESKRRKIAKKANDQALFEAQLKRVIDEEVKNVMQEMNLSGGWVYGNNKPSRSRAGYTHQGSYIPGIGFRR